MLEWLIAPFMGHFGFVVSFSDAVKSRARRGWAAGAPAVVVAIGLFFASDSVIKLFIARGRAVSKLISDVIQDVLGRQRASDRAVGDRAVLRYMRPFRRAGRRGV